MKTKSKTEWIKVPQRIKSFGEKMQEYRLARHQSILDARQAKRNKKITKAEKEAIEAQLAAPDNDL